MFSGYINKIKNILGGILNSRINIIGIDLKDTSISCVVMDTDYKNVKEFYAQIPAGIMSNGMIMDRERLSQILIDLKNKISKKKNQITAILSISDKNVYTQVIDLPYVSGKSEKDVVSLNMEMVSPIDLDNAYSDWQYLDEEGNKREHKRILASFIDKRIIDDILSVFESAGFLIVAIEQRAESLSRIIKKNISNNQTNITSIILDLNSDGLSLSINSDGNLMFNRFIGWNELATNNSKEIEFDKFKDLVLEECHRMINYYTNKFGEKPEIIYINSGDIGEKLKPFLQQEFNMKIYDLKYKNLSYKSVAAVGAALRGTIRRSRDSYITLTPSSVKEEFFKEQLIAFIQLWIEIIFVTSLVILLTMLGEFVFLGKYIEKTNNSLSKVYKNNNASALNELISEADVFNENISIAKQIFGTKENYSELINEIFSIAKNNSVQIKRLYIQPKKDLINIIARAENEEVAVNFKNNLEKIKNISKIKMPLDNITQDLNGGVLFNINIGKF